MRARIPGARWRLRTSFGRIVLSLCLLTGGGSARLDAQDAETGEGLWQPGPGLSRSAGVAEPETIARLRERARAKGSPEAWLAFGAALLHSGDWQGAVPPLRRALDSRDPEIRTDAVYDLALAWALAGSPDPPTAGPEPVPGDPGQPDDPELDDPGTPRDRLLRARDGFRAVLRADPGSEDARWNLELV